jgi:hypothetical protein
VAEDREVVEIICAVVFIILLVLVRSGGKLLEGFHPFEDKVFRVYRHI